MVEEKKKDLLEKGAIVQRDYETYAIAPQMPGGICEPCRLRKIADVAEKYSAKALKLTSAQRIAIVGLAESDIDAAWHDLDMPPGAAIGLCVRSVKNYYKNCDTKKRLGRYIKEVGFEEFKKEVLQTYISGEGKT